MKARVAASAVALALALCGNAYAQTGVKPPPVPAKAAPVKAVAPAAPESVETKMAAAKDLLVAMQAKEMFKAQFEASLPKQMANIQREYPDMSKDMRALIETTFREETEKSLDSLMTDIAGLYAKRFSSDEMKTIATFHRTKAGAKLRNESEQLQRELTGVANTWSLEVVRKISKRLQEQLREDRKRNSGISS